MAPLRVLALVVRTVNHAVLSINPLIADRS